MTDSTGPDEYTNFGGELEAMGRHIELNGLQIRLEEIATRVRGVIDQREHHLDYQLIEHKWAEHLTTFRVCICTTITWRDEAPDWLMLNPVDEPESTLADIWVNETLQMVRGVTRWLARAFHYVPEEVERLADVESAYAELLRDIVGSRGGETWTP